MQLVVARYASQETFDIEWIEIDTDMGNRIIQEGHAPLIVVLKKDSRATFFVKDIGEQLMKIPGGFFSVNPEHAILLVTE